MANIPSSTGFEGSRMGRPAIVVGMLAAIGLAYILLVVQPGLLRSFNAALSTWPRSDDRPAWMLTALVIAAASVGASIAMVTLATFVRSAQRHPYLWLSPLIVGFASVIVLRSSVALPIANLPVPLFTICGSLLMLAGGALLHVRDALLRTSGTLLLGLPVATLFIGLALQAGGTEWELLAASWTLQDAPSKLAMLTFAWTSVALGLLALGTRPRPRRGRHGLELDESEVTGVYTGAVAASAFPAAGLGRATAVAILTLCLTALFGYLGFYRPLLEREARAVVSLNQQLQAIDQLRASFESERATLRGELEAARAKMPPHASAAASEVPHPELHVAPKLARIDGVDEPAHAEVRAAAKPIANPQPTQNTAAVPPRPARPQTVTGSAAPITRYAPPASAAPAASKPTPKPSMKERPQPNAVPSAKDRARLGGAIDDDPIGGLDDL